MPPISFDEVHIGDVDNAAMILSMTFFGVKVKVHMNGDNTFGDVKEEMWDMFNLVPESYYLCAPGSNAVDDSTLLGRVAVDGGRLEFCPRMKGGAPPKRPRVTLAEVGARAGDPPLVADCFNVRQFNATEFVNSLSDGELKDYSAYLDKNKHVKRITEHTVTLMSCVKAPANAREMLDQRAAAAEIWLQDLVETSISGITLEEWRISIRQACRARVAQQMRD
jgi:hypothetical protein